MAQIRHIIRVIEILFLKREAIIINTAATGTAEIM
jgi:hypothetical protein